MHGAESLKKITFASFT